VRLVLTVLLLIAVNPAWAKWVKGAETDEAVIYIDSAKIRKHGQLRRVWRLQDLKQRDPDGVLSRRGLQEFDCKGKRFRVLSGTGYGGSMGTGQALRSFDSATEWVDIKPDTPAEDILTRVCVR
jgi:hypothetical protein